MKSFNYWALSLRRSVAAGGDVTKAAVRDLRRQYLRWLERKRKSKRNRNDVPGKWLR
jgi:hypothetical protein